MKIIIVFLIPVLIALTSTLTPHSAQSGKVSLLLPEDFKVMEAELRTYKYPGKDPGVTDIFTSPDGQVNVLLEHTQSRASEGDMEVFIEIMAKQFEAMPQIEILNKEVISLHGHRYIRFETMSTTNFGKTYSHTLITPLEGKLLVSAINFPEGLLPQWKDTGKKIIESVKTLR